MTLALDVPPVGDSLFARMDPRWKLASLVPAALMVSLLQGIPSAALALLAALLLAWLARLPVDWLGRRLGWTAFFLLLFLIWLPLLPEPGGEIVDIAGLRLSQTGLVRLAVVLLKTLGVVTLLMIVLATAPLHDTLKAAQCLRVPRVLVHLLLLTLRYVYLLADEFVRLRTALRVRGFRNRADLHSWQTIGQVSGTLLVRGYERGERVHQAMQCRGFDGSFQSLHGFRTRSADVLLGSIILGAAAALLAWDVRGI